MNERNFILHGDGLGLLVRRQQMDGAPVLYIHGATFPSALSAAYRFGDRSWMDDWNARGLDAWAFDFAGYGGSDPYPEMEHEIGGAPLGRAAECADQIARAVSHVCAVTGHKRVAVVAHSWGTIAAALYACREPERVSALCLFGPILQREGASMKAPQQRWRLVTMEEQLARFTAEVPKDHPPVLIEPALHAWGAAYLASDRNASSRTPHAVRIPNGPAADIADAWSGRLAWRPQDLHCPVLCVRGEWDNLTTDADAAWLMPQLVHPLRRDAKIPKGTHLMHLEHSRDGLFAAVGDFLGQVP